MRSSDWRRLSLITLVLGLIFLVTGLITWFYSETVPIGREFEIFRVGTYPYRNYGVPLLILGVSCLAVGFLSFRFAEEERRYEAKA